MHGSRRRLHLHAAVDNKWAVCDGLDETVCGADDRKVIDGHIRLGKPRLHNSNSEGHELPTGALSQGHKPVRCPANKARRTAAAMLRLSPEQVLYKRVQVPRPLDRLLRLSTHLIKIVSALTRRTATRILAVPEKDRDRVGCFLDRDDIGAFAVVVVINDEGGKARFQIPDEVLLD